MSTEGAPTRSLKTGYSDFEDLQGSWSEAMVWWGSNLLLTTCYYKSFLAVFGLCTSLCGRTWCWHLTCASRRTGRMPYHCLTLLPWLGKTLHIVRP